MKKDYVIKILFIENSLDEAEQTISLLRNAGIAVRPARATNTDDLQAALDNLEPDLVLFDPDVSTLSQAEVVRLLDSDGRDYSLLGLVNVLDNQVVADLFERGARGVASRTAPTQLITVLQREFEALQTRREVRRLETALRESDRRCDALLGSSTDAIAYVHEGMHVRANRAYLDAFGYESFDDLLGLPVLDMIDAANAEAFKAALRGHSRQKKLPAQLPVRTRHADGSGFDAIAEFAQATFEGEPCLQIVFRRQVVDPATWERRQRDAVTGLFNRARMLESIDDAVSAAATGSKGHSVLLVEPDNWASIVNSIGLSKTDELLAGLADRVRTQLGADDAAGMLAEHTFGIVLSPRSDEAIKEWITQLQQSISTEIFDAGARSLTVTASIGGSFLVEKSANAELLLNQASEALRNAQSCGENKVELHDPAAHEKADSKREQHWLNLLKQAMADDSLLLYFQQIISLQDAEGDYAEILLRMNGPQGEVLPTTFMPIAERHGLHATIDRYVIHHAIKALQVREAQGQQTTFFIKLTTASLQDPTLLPWLADSLEKAALKRGHIVLEMTESKVMLLLRPAQEFVRGWKELGGSFALEQFGSGLNSFQLLNHIDADYLKIDRSYMADLPQHEENQKKVAEICNRARKLKRQTIAEWVEDANSTSLLFACGVDFVQGNFLQVPGPLVN